MNKQPTLVRVEMLLPKPDYERLKKTAVEAKIPVSQLIRNLLAIGIDTITKEYKETMPKN